MPELGTVRECVFCHATVRLQRAASGWHYWTKDGEPVDGRHRCHGGVGPGTSYNPTPVTLHVPVPRTNGDGEVVERWAGRYAPSGAPQDPYGATIWRTA